MPEDEAAAKAAEAELQTALSGIPNLPFDEVPVGPDETANVELRKVGTPRAFAFEPRQHFELGEQLGLMDFETAAKLSGARFVVLKGALARLERALGCFMLDVQTGEHGYTEVNPPILVSDEAMFGTAQLPKFREDQFAVSRIDEHSVRSYADALIDFSEVRLPGGCLISRHWFPIFS